MSGRPSISRPLVACGLVLGLALSLSCGQGSGVDDGVGLRMELTMADEARQPAGVEVDRFDLTGQYTDGDQEQAFSESVAASGQSARASVTVQKDRLLLIDAEAVAGGVVTHEGSTSIDTGSTALATITLQPRPDTNDPEVAITEPEDETQFEVGSEVTVEVTVRNVPATSVTFNVGGEEVTQTGTFDVGTTLTETFSLNTVGTVTILVTGAFVTGGEDTSEIEINVVDSSSTGLVRAIAPCDTDNADNGIVGLGSVEVRAGDTLRLSGDTISAATTFDLLGVVSCSSNVLDDFPEFGETRNDPGQMDFAIVDGGRTCSFPPVENLPCPDDALAISGDATCKIFAGISNATSGKEGFPTDPLCVERGTCAAGAAPFNRSCADKDVAEFSFQVFVNGILLLE